MEMLYGEVPPWTVRAYTVKADGFPMAIIGVARERAGLRAFFDIMDEEDANLFVVKRAIIDVVRHLVAPAKLPVYAVAEHATGAKLLERLGFTQVDEDYYEWLN